MSLDPAYLDYPRRRRGYDHDLYPWSALKDRPPVTWPGGAPIAVWICVGAEVFPLIPADTPFRAPGHMQTPYPDYRHYTARDYGNRVGIYRLLDAFAAAGARVSVAANSALARHAPPLLADIVAAGHEIIAHSTNMNGTIDSSLPEDEERLLIAQSLDELEAATGTRPAGWLSIARSQSWRTPDLLKAAGVDYCCDWVNDELPWRFANGLINLPLNHDLSDRQVIAVQQNSAESYAGQLLDAFDFLGREGRACGGGRMLPIHLTPYISGLPYRVGAIEALLAGLVERGAWFASGGEIVAAWKEQQ